MKNLKKLLVLSLFVACSAVAGLENLPKNSPVHGIVTAGKPDFKKAWGITTGGIIDIRKVRIVNHVNDLCNAFPGKELTQEHQRDIVRHLEDVKVKTLAQLKAERFAHLYDGKDHKNNFRLIHDAYVMSAVMELRLMQQNVYTNACKYSYLPSYANKLYESGCKKGYSEIAGRLAGNLKGIQAFKGKNWTETLDRFAIWRKMSTKTGIDNAMRCKNSPMGRILDAYNAKRSKIDLDKKSGPSPKA